MGTSRWTKETRRFEFMNKNTKEAIKAVARSITQITSYEVGEPGDEPTPKVVAWMKLGIEAELLFRIIDKDETIL